MPFANEPRCPTCGGALSDERCQQCDSSTSTVRPYAFHPLRRDDLPWSAPTRSHSSAGAPALSSPVPIALAQRAPAVIAPAVIAPAVIALAAIPATLTSAMQNPSAADPLPAVGVVGVRVVIRRFGDNRIAVIKAVRAFSLLGLSEVVQRLDATPATFVVSAHDVSLDDIARSLDAVRCDWSFENTSEAQAVASAPPKTATSSEGMGVVLGRVGVHKIELIKLVRELTGLGLLDSKNAVEAPGSPLSLRTTLTIEQLRARFEQLGCEVSFVSGCW